MGPHLERTCRVLFHAVSSAANPSTTEAIGDEPWHSVIVVLSLGTPAFFLAMAVLAVILGRRGRPLD